MVTESLIALRHEVEHRGSNPRVHPNGFIQLDLQEPEDEQRGHSGAARRLHIWNPVGLTLPRQETRTPVHDHVFDMRSMVAAGGLYQVLYDFIPCDDENEATHALYQAVYGRASSSRLEPTGVWGKLESQPWIRVVSPSSYTQPAFTFHDTWPIAELGPTVTVMTKVAVHEGDATVVCEVGQQPDNSFDRTRALDADTIWDAINDTLRWVMR